MDIQLVFQFAISEVTDFDKLLSLENLFQIILGENHLVDGHDFGSAEMNIFVHTNDPERAFELCEPNIPPELRTSLRVAYRPLSEDEYHWAYPAGSSSEFKVA
jgi:hypothetical protein|tara:strand:- start:782 stop:1090 length:309 start_codon:yes stop_codon:yes gene_type:complete